jgi:hypothetical protein
MTIELAKRAVACGRWISPRMHAFREMADGEIGPSCTVVLVDGPVAHVVWDQGSGRLKPIAVAELLPDLSDPATIGCLLAIVREAWGDELVHVSPRVEDPEDTGALYGLPAAWIVGSTGVHGYREFLGSRGRRPRFGSEAEALVHALEAAP